ncbi:carbon-nitrogen hydrolase family protein [Leucobacter insecticola]|uniref:Carbon-nitrogen hydrolase family protein n=1 Tax=Leucobacter insecticola TaxID=2714934 RepID=A0A6G8FMD5_9MICO|nr:carbon-nitrogen hydrolase family protein [Leucobacter insecticola]
MELSVAQFSATQDIENNRSISVSLIRRAGSSADLVVLPENAMYSDPTKEGPAAGYSEPLDGPFVSAIRETAKLAAINVVVGFTESSDEDRPYNTLIFVDATGELSGVYRKIHLYDAFGYRESDSVKAAETAVPLVFEIKGVKVGAETCYDLRFPEVSRWLIDHDVDVIVLPAAWAVGPMKEIHWETLIRARAVENTVYFAASGQTGPHCTGQSIIVDPLGTVRASAGVEAEAIATTTISTERIAQVRAVNPCLTNRRFTVKPNVYT